MGTAPTRLTREQFVECLHKVIGGMTYKELSQEVPYKVPFLSTKIKQIAKEEGLLSDLVLALQLQKAKRNKSGVIKNYGRSYIFARKYSAKEWRKIPNYENYEVSNNGLVRKKNHICSVSIVETNFTRYAHIFLSKNGVKKGFPIHRLVLLAFKPIADPDKYQVDHANRNGLDNKVENLRWCTPSENIKYSFYLNEDAKKAICSNGGKIAGQHAYVRAVEKYKKLLGDRFISYQQEANSTVTYVCKHCGETLTEPITSRCFRHGADGICGKCRRIVKKELNHDKGELAFGD